MAATSVPSAYEPRDMNFFTLFPQLPPELRIKIWHSSYTPRRITHSIYAPKSPPNPTSSCALLLVSHEARSCFLSQYTLWTHSSMLWLPASKRQQTYINFSIDALCISNLKDLSYLMALYPNVMQQVQWMDLMPSKWPRFINWKNDEGEYVLQSLRLLTLKNTNTLPSHNKNANEKEEKFWIDNEFLVALVDKLGSDLKEQYHAIGKAPVIAGLFRPEEQDREAVAKEAIECGFYMQEPSPDTWARFEVEMHMEDENWPGRDFEKAGERGWIAAEFVIIGDWLESLLNDVVV